MVSLFWLHAVVEPTSSLKMTKLKLKYTWINHKARCFFFLWNQANFFRENIMYTYKKLGLILPISSLA